MIAREAAVRVDPTAFAPVSRHLFGALVEHFGRVLYGGLWNGARHAPRADVASAVRALGTTMFRYPGGCFADWYHWRDGIGPRGQRPVYDEQFWTTFRFGDAVSAELAREMGPVEDNAVGTDEMLRHCLDLGVEPMLVANFGSGTPEEAAAWVEHCNRSGRAPSPVRWWSVGNETYGTWEIGHCSSSEYARRYVEFSRAMRAVDPDIRIVAVGCGGHGPEGATKDWNTTVLREAAGHVDALSVHFYFPGPWLGRGRRDDEGDYLQVATGADELGAQLDAVIAEVDSVEPSARAPLSLDEWNLWFEWPELVTSNHTLGDAVFFAGCHNRLLERADRVSMAMISQLVNCMAPIQVRGERSFVTSSYLVIQMYAQAMRAGAARVDVECDQITAAPFADTAPPPPEAFGGRTGRVLDAAASVDSGGVTVFLANRSLDTPLRVTVSGLPAGGAGRLRHLDGDGPFARNSEDRPDAIRWRERRVDADRTGRCSVELPPHTAGALEMEHP